LPVPSRHLRLALGLLLLGGACWGVLRAGERLHAPAKLGGTWVVDAPDACLAAAPGFTLSQSGVFLEVSWPGGPAEHLRGRLDGDHFTLTAEDGACPDTRLTGTWTPDGVEALLAPAGCGLCAPGGIVRARPAAPGARP
jgi:hypothetical protein